MRRMRCVVCGAQANVPDSASLGKWRDGNSGAVRKDFVAPREWRYADGAVASTCPRCYRLPDEEISAEREKLEARGEIVLVAV